MWPALGLACALAAFAVSGGGPIDSAPEWSLRQALAGSLAAAAGLLLASMVSGALAPRAAPSGVPLRALLAPPRLFDVGVPLATAAIAAGAIVLRVLRRGAFKWLESEDGPVETLTVLLLLIAAGCFATIAARARGRAIRRIVTGVLAAVLVLAAMEEISWFQRLFGLQTPPAFAANQQGEINLHNFASAAFDRAAYACGFAALILVPLLGAHLRPLAARLQVGDLLPGRDVLLVAVPLAALGLRWWLVETQIALFFVLGLVGFGLAAALRRPRHPVTLPEVHLATLAATFALALLVLAFLRNSFGEFIELTMTLALAVWAVQSVRADD